jgi:hypothetical protein
MTDLLGEGRRDDLMLFCFAFFFFQVWHFCRWGRISNVSNEDGNCKMESRCIFFECFSNLRLTWNGEREIWFLILYLLKVKGFIFIWGSEVCVLAPKYGTGQFSLK